MATNAPTLKINNGSPLGAGIALAVRTDAKLRDAVVVAEDASVEVATLSDGADGFVDVLKKLDSLAGELHAADSDAFATDVAHVASTLLPTLGDEKAAKRALFKFNTHMLMRTFASGHAASLLDLALLAPMRPVVAGWDVKEQAIMCNITRWFNLAQTLVPTADAAFERLALSEDAPPVQKKPKAAANGGDKNNKGNKGDAADSATASTKQKKPKQPKKPVAADKPIDVSRLNFLVGKIVEVEKHPNADSLYIEKIDVGEESGPRTIVSGLVKFVPIDEMKDRMVVIVANLKPANLKSVKSYGMVLCASNADHTEVELLEPPAGSKIGERVMAAGFDGEADAQIDVKKKNNAWTPVAADLALVDGVPSYKGVALATATGNLTVKSLKTGTIS